MPGVVRATDCCSKSPRKPFAEIDAAVFAKVEDGFTGGWVERVEEVQHARKKPGVLAVGPVCEASRRLAVFDSGVESPEQFASGAIEGDDFSGEGIAEEHATDYKGIGFQVAFFSRVELPGNLELGNIGAINERERRVVLAVDITVVSGPVDVRPRRSLDGRGRG